MIIISNIQNTVYATLGSADCNGLPPLLFKTKRKGTEATVSLDIVKTLANNRWIEFTIDGTNYEIGEHNYTIQDSAGEVYERGILIVKNGDEKTTAEYQGSDEGQKGEYS